MSVRAAVFDLDGTLLNTLDDLCDSVNAVLRAQGNPPRSRDEVRAFVGNGIRQLMALSLPADANDLTIERAYQAMLVYYPSHCAVRTAPYPGVPELLHALRAAGVRVAVVSNKADEATRALCERYFPALVDVALGERPGVPRKPAPDAVWEALRLLDCPRGQAVYVGDSDVDVRTAEAAGVAGVFVSWGFRSRAALEAAGAKRIVNSAEALREAVLRLGFGLD